MALLSEELLNVDKLTIRNMQLADRHLEKLCKIVSTNTRLRELDISWNRFTPQGMIKFVSHLEAENKL